MFLLRQISVSKLYRSNTHKSLKHGHFFKSSKFSKFVIILRDWGLSNHGDTKWHPVSAEDRLQPRQHQFWARYRFSEDFSNEEVYRYLAWNRKSFRILPFSRKSRDKTAELVVLLSVLTAKPFWPEILFIFNKPSLTCLWSNTVIARWTLTVYEITFLEKSTWHVGMMYSNLESWNCLNPLIPPFAPKLSKDCSPDQMCDHTFELEWLGEA